MVVGKSWEYSWTTFLPKGQITVKGPFSDTGDSVIAHHRGHGRLPECAWGDGAQYRDPAGTKFDFVFHVIG